MKKIKTENSIVMENNKSIFNYHGWPSVAVLQNDQIAVVASAHRLAHICPFGKVLMAKSMDFGKTYSAPQIIIDTPLDDRDAGICTFGEKSVIVTSFNNTIAQQRSWNEKQRNEKTKQFVNSYLNIIDEKDIESEFIGSTFKISNDYGSSFGELKKIPISSPHGPCKLSEHELLYVGRPFSCNGDVKKDEKIEVYKLKENGEYEFLSVIENISDEYGEMFSCEPTQIVLPNGKIIVHIRVQRDGVSPKFEIYQSVSNDGGKTFSSPQFLTHGSPPHLMRHSSGIIICSYGYRNKPFGQRIMISRNDGETWETDLILRDDGETLDLGYPCTCELPDGKLLTVYYQAQKGRENCVIMQSIWNVEDNL